jgi:hypothetical protein
MKPKSGLYENGPAHNVFKVVNVAGGQGIELKEIYVPMDCEGRHDLGFEFSESRPIPIKNGKFNFKKSGDAASTSPQNGEEHLHYKFRISGTFKSPTKLVGEESAGTLLTYGLPGEATNTLMCDGDLAFRLTRK